MKCEWPNCNNTARYIHVFSWDRLCWTHKKKRARPHRYVSLKTPEGKKLIAELVLSEMTP